MTGKRLWYLLAIATLASGCGVARELVRNTAAEIEYHDLTDECLTNERNGMLASSSWHEYQRANPECDHSRDYAHGFKDGFTDYLNGGSGDPPVIPPRRYWTVSNRTEAGHQRAEEWFSGFRAGAIAAEQSGYRSWATIHVSMSTMHGINQGTHSE